MIAVRQDPDALVLGIDASNLRGGGGVNHLRELLAAAEPVRFGFREVIVWGSTGTIAVLPERNWLERVRVSVLDRSLPFRLIWQTLALPAVLRVRCDILFAPGGSVHRGVIPYVTMSRNLLPFDRVERRRYGLSTARLRLMLLERSQRRTFEKADGIIFLSEHARDVVTSRLRSVPATRIIPHGVAPRFQAEAPRREEPDQPFRILYVSPVKPYKHQWNVVEAIARLRDEGLSVELDLVGQSDHASKRKLDIARRQFDPEQRWVRYHGVVAHAAVAEHYRHADGFVFASTCENLPNILLEAMAAGLPIVSSDRPPMPEVLGDATLYFDPEDAKDMSDKIRRIVVDENTRHTLAERAWRRSRRSQSWRQCADATFGFLRDIATRCGGDPS